MIDFIKLLSPYAPHMCEEMYQHYTGEETIAYASWPTYDEKALVQDEVTIVVQVNGKVRGRFDVAVGTDEDTLKEEAMKIENVQRQVEGKTIRKVIIIKGKVVNIVAN